MDQNVPNVNGYKQGVHREHTHYTWTQSDQTVDGNINTRRKVATLISEHHRKRDRKLYNMFTKTFPVRQTTRYTSKGHGFQGRNGGNGGVQTLGSQNKR